MMNEILVECKKDDDFVFNRKVENSCGENFCLDEENTFSIFYTDYEGNFLEQYYAICPNCGYMVVLDENLLSDSIKENTRMKTMLDHYLFRKNELKSELIYLESISKKKKVRRI